MNIQDIKNFLENEHLLKNLIIRGIKPGSIKENKIIIKQILNKYNWLENSSEIFYLINHKKELENLHIFCNCGNKNKFICKTSGYFHHCSNKCRLSDKNIIQSIINSNKIIGEDGLNGYQRGARKSAIIKKQTIDKEGLNTYQRNTKKAEQTTYKKTGFKHHQQTEKWKQTMKSKKDEINQKRGNKNEIKYGNRVYARSSHRFYLDPNHKHYEDINEEFFRNNFIIDGKFDVEKCANYFGTSESWVLNHKNKFNIIEKNIKNYISKPQKQVYDYIKQIYNNKINYGTFKIIPPQELDIYLPDVNLAIEFNGVYWHSTKANKHKYYHQNKFKACLAKGIRLIHIYEDEWNDNRKREIIKNIIKRAIGLDTKNAENIKIDEIIEEQYIDFCNKYNLEGYKEADIKLGLFVNNELIQVLAFKNKYNYYKIIINCYNFDLYKDYTKELLEYFNVNYNKIKLHIMIDICCDKDEIQVYLDCGFKITSLLDPRKRKYKDLVVFDSGVFTLII